VRLVRSAAPFASVAAAKAEMEACDQALAKSGPTAELGILLDWRLPPLSRDAELIAVLVQGTDRICSRFTRSAMLVSTQVGKMQSIRLNRMQSTPPTPFDDEAKALMYVTHD
jgi:hypothetical protein